MGLYPEIYVDRPLLHPDGMTTLDLSLELPQYTNADGSKERDPTLDILVEHSFGIVEVSGQLEGGRYGPVFSLDAAADLAEAGAIGVALYAQAPSNISIVDRDVGQSIHYDWKWIASPHHFAVDVGASASVDEIALKPQPMMSRLTGSLAGAGLGIAAQVQLAPRVALQVGPFASVVLHETAGLPARHAEVGAESAIVVTIGHWDLYAQLRVFDATRTHTLFGAAGFVHRWGD